MQYLTVGKSRMLDVISCASGQYFSTSWSISHSSFLGPSRPWKLEAVLVSDWKNYSALFARRQVLPSSVVNHA